MNGEGPRAMRYKVVKNTYLLLQAGKIKKK